MSETDRWTDAPAPGVTLADNEGRRWIVTARDRSSNTITVVALPDTEQAIGLSE